MSRNSTVLLILFTIFNSQPQSKGSLVEVEATTSQSPESFLSNLEAADDDFEEPESQEIEDYYDSLVKRSTNDQPSRRSATDRNFQRYGRSSFFPTQDKNNKEKNIIRLIRGTNDNFMRFGRANKANFMRFGRASNFMRFGKTDKNFMRFGKRDKNFMRYGKNDKNFMRFGKTDKNFMRFGRNDIPYDDEYDRIDRSDKNFLRFGKSPSKTNFMRFGRAENFLRFGKANKQNFMRFGRDNKRVVRDIGDNDGMSLWEVEEENDPDDILRSSRDVKNTVTIPHIRYGRDTRENKTSLFNTKVNEVGMGMLVADESPQDSSG